MTHDLVFDPGLVLRACRGEQAPAMRMLEVFLRLNATDFAQLQDAMREREFAEIHYLAHRMRGAAQTLGAMNFAQACQSLEEAASLESFEAVEAEWTAFAREAQRLEGAIRQYLRP